VIADELFRPQAIELLQRLRDTLGTVIDYPFNPTKVGKQFQIAEERGFSKAIVVDAQILQGEVQIKDLATRDQQRCSIQDLTAGKLFPSS
jgi:histidyl-tRNA synthetase